MFFSLSYKNNSCRRAKVTFVPVLLEQVRSPWVWEEKSEADEGILNSSCSVALRPLLQKQRQLLTSGFLHNH